MDITKEQILKDYSKRHNLQEKDKILHISKLVENKLASLELSNKMESCTIKHTKERRRCNMSDSIKRSKNINSKKDIEHLTVLDHSVYSRRYSLEAQPSKSRKNSLCQTRDCQSSKFINNNGFKEMLNGRAKYLETWLVDHEELLQLNCETNGYIKEDEMHTTQIRCPINIADGRDFPNDMEELEKSSPDNATDSLFDEEFVRKYSNKWEGFITRESTAIRRNKERIQGFHSSKNLVSMSNIMLTPFQHKPTSNNNEPCTRTRRENDVSSIRSILLQNDVYNNINPSVETNTSRTRRLIEERSTINTKSSRRIEKKIDEKHKCSIMSPTMSISNDMFSLDGLLSRDKYNMPQFRGTNKANLTMALGRKRATDSMNRTRKVDRSANGSEPFNDLHIRQMRAKLQECKRSKEKDRAQMQMYLDQIKRRVSVEQSLESVAITETLDKIFNAAPGR